jgi:hypothetical protein
MKIRILRVFMFLCFLFVAFCAIFAIYGFVGGWRFSQWYGTIPFSLGAVLFSLVVQYILIGKWQPLYLFKGEGKGL